MLDKVKFKLAAMVLLLALMPFANVFACGCDGKDPVFQPQSDVYSDDSSN